MSIPAVFPNFAGIVRLHARWLMVTQLTAMPVMSDPRRYTRQKRLAASSPESPSHIMVSPKLLGHSDYCSTGTDPEVPFLGHGDLIGARPAAQQAATDAAR
jgi:hypothetical protein